MTQIGNKRCFLKTTIEKYFFWTRTDQVDFRKTGHRRCWNVVCTNYQLATNSWQLIEGIWYSKEKRKTDKRNVTLPNDNNDEADSEGNQIMIEGQAVQWRLSNAGGWILRQSANLANHLNPSQSVNIRGNIWAKIHTNLSIFEDIYVNKNHLNLWIYDGELHEQKYIWKF